MEIKMVNPYGSSDNKKSIILNDSIPGYINLSFFLIQAESTLAVDKNVDIKCSL